MATTAEKEARLARLEKLRDSGATEGVVDGINLKFRSQTELTQRIIQLERELGIRRARKRSRPVYMGHR